MSGKGRFRIGRASSPSYNVLESPTSTQLTFQAYPNPTPPAPPAGSYEHDLASGSYPLQWANWDDFHNWRTAEERAQCVELRLAKTYYGLPEFERQCRYVCSRGSTGGIKEYAKLHPDWQRKIPSKRTDCMCILLVKQYPGVSLILGNYRSEHNHPIGNANLRFTQISKETKEYIAGLLRLKVAPDHIVTIRIINIYLRALMTPSSTFFTMEFTTTTISLTTIRTSVRLHPDDGQSTLHWVEKLRVKGYLLGFKSKTDPVPLGSNLAPDLFTLMVQTDWQRKMFQKYGSALLCIDATHNCTMYANLNLTTLVVRDDWAHGMS
ncbi:hypothetical protein B0H16DRAFT_1348443 [Mycena metata]|uniref:FAR1 domain-containing protein n=1 Tax=Mycena metata TaxID=1033252 RepID=A0AAD7GM22_9AGAR|nr:hypothetical protein B0H16DRAFT_1348443 [Mycena metata]